MTDLIDFLLAQIQREEDATAELDRAEFFTWLDAGQPRYGNSGHMWLRQDEQSFLQLQTPHAARNRVRAHRAIVETCRAALRFGDVPGMEAARLMATETLCELAQAYEKRGGWKDEWKR